MDTLTRLFESLLSALGPFVPRVLGAMALLLAAWVGGAVIAAATRTPTDRSPMSTPLRVFFCIPHLLWLS